MVASDTWDTKVKNWRVAMFEEMGFDADQAQALSEATADGKLQDGWFVSTHAVRAMLANGCSHDLVMKIVF